MSSVDNRIVKMTMENSQFTKAANATMSTLGKLSDSLKLTEGAKGLQNLTKKVKEVDMSGLATGVDTVRQRFSTLDVVGVTALVNISNSAINAGKNLIKSLTVDPVMDGLREYETKMGSIQTILTNTSSKGTTLDDVNAALADLNEYSDKTIYNFAQMTDNIGKATAAGVGLQDAVTFVKGLANVAAGFGVDATAMAGATQQMTQALASGTVRLQDWMSMENRGMGGEMLQNALYQTAEEMGVYVDKSKSFRYTLEQNWLSSDIFIKTMEKMANDQSLVEAATKVKTFSQLIDTMKETVGSGWAVTWEHILGDKNQATELFTSISEGFGVLSGSMADYRNEALKTWNQEGGREAVLNGLKNILTSIGNILGPIYQAFKNIFDPWNADRMIALSKAFEKFTEALKISDKTGDLITKTLTGLLSIFKLIGIALKPIGALLAGIFTGLAGGGSSLIDILFTITSGLTGWITAVVEFIEESWLFQKVVEGMTLAGEKFGKAIQYTFGNMEEVVSNGMGLATEYMGKFASSLGSYIPVVLDKMTQFKEFLIEFNEVYKPMDKVKETVINMKDAIIKAFEAAQNGIQSFLDFVKTSVDNVKSFFKSIADTVAASDIQAIDFVNAGLFAGILVFGKKLYKFLKQFFKTIGSFKESALDTLDALQGVLESYQKNIKADTIKKIAVAVALLAGSIFILSKVDPERLIPSVTALGVLMAGLMGALWTFNKIDPKGLKDSTATIISLIGIATALNILASAMVKLSSLDWMQILKAVTGLSAACLAVFALTKSMKGTEITPKQGVSLILMATSLYALAGAMAIIGNLDGDTIFKSLGVIATVLTGISLFFNSTKGVGNSAKVALSLVPLTTSLLLLAGALAIFGNMNIGTLTQGFIVLALALTELSLFTNSMRGFKGNMTGIGAGILILSGALLMLTGVLAILGNMEISTLAKGLISMGVALGLISVAMNLMPKSAISSGTGMLVLASGLMVLSLALKVLGGLSWETILKGMVTLVGTIAILGGMSVLLAAAIPAMTGMAGAIALLGAGAGAVGLGLMVLSVGLTMFSGSVMGASVALVTALISIASTIPIFAAAIALGIVSFITVLAYNAPALKRAFVDLLNMLAQTFIESIPKFMEAIVVFVTELSNAIIKMTPSILEAVKVVILGLIGLVADFLVALGEAVIKALPVLLEAVSVALTGVIELIGDLLVKLGEEIIRSAPVLVDAVVTVIMSIIEALTENIPIIAGLVVESLLELIATVLEELALGIPKISAAIVDIIVAIITSIGDGVPRIVNAIFDMVIAMINGLADSVETKMPEVRAAIKRLTTAIIEEFKAAIADAVTIGSDIVGGLVEGISSGWTWVKETAAGVAEAALNAARTVLDINSPSREFAKLGMWSDKGFAGGIKKYGGVVEDAVDGVAGGALNGMRSALSAVNELFDTDVSNEPVIRPVIDLSEVEQGITDVDSLFGKNRDLALGFNDVGGKTLRRIGTVTSPQSQNAGIVDAIKDLKKSIGGNNDSGNVTNINGITYDDGTNVSEAVETLVRAAKIKRRS